MYYAVQYSYKIDIKEWKSERSSQLCTQLQLVAKRKPETLISLERDYII